MSGKSSRFASQWSAYAKRKPQYHIHTIQPYPTLLPAMCVCGVSVCSCMYACTGICMHAHGSKTRFRGLRIHQSWTAISVAWCCPEHGLVQRLPVGALGRSQLGPGAAIIKVSRGPTRRVVALKTTIWARRTDSSVQMCKTRTRKKVVTNKPFNKP